MRPFLYHIRPRMFSCFHTKLVELRIDPLGIRLKGNDLRTGRPYPNKSYDVGHRRIGRKHVDGILLALSDWPPDLEVQASWAIAAEIVLKHRVMYKLLDTDFGAASDDMSLWHAAVEVNDDWKTADNPLQAWKETPTKFQNRRPEWAKDAVACTAEPCMLVSLDEPPADKTEVFALPTIEPERILGPDYPHERIALPTLEMAIKL